jgi:threonine/homoserine/homoserine lactone efflux protein
LILEGLLRGLAVGVLAGVPLGPASVAVVHLALRESRARALALGGGAALVDFTYCLAATTGMGAVFDTWPTVAEAFRTGGGALLLAIGLAMVLRAGHPIPRRDVEALTRGKRRAFATGILISVLNPALLSSWVLFSSTFLAGLGTTGAVAASVGAFVGTFGWFFVVAWSAARFRGHPLLQSAWVPRVLGLLLAGYGALLVVEPLVGEVARG